MALGVPMARRCPEQAKSSYIPAVAAVAAQSPVFSATSIHGQAGYQNALRQARAAGAKIRSSGGSSMGRSGSAGYSTSSSRSLGGRGLY